MTTDFCKPYIFTTSQYINFKFSFPYVDTKNLIEVPSQIKTPTIVTLIESCNYELYKKQNLEKKEYMNKLRERILMNNKSDDIQNIINPVHNHKYIVSYVLLQQNYRWIKNLM